jgi:hypothetical protein
MLSAFRSQMLIDLQIVIASIHSPVPNSTTLIQTLKLGSLYRRPTMAKGCLLLTLLIFMILFAVSSVCIEYTLWIFPDIPHSEVLHQAQWATGLSTMVLVVVFAVAFYAVALQDAHKARNQLNVRLSEIITREDGYQQFENPSV